MNVKDEHLEHLERLQGMQYGQESMKWYGWGSPTGLGLALLSVGGFIWLLHMSGLIGR